MEKDLAPAAGICPCALKQGPCRPISVVLRTRPLFLRSRLVRLLLVLRRHVMADGATTRGAQHTMMRHMPGKTADRGPLEAALRLHRAGQASRENQGKSRRDSQ